MAPAQVIVVDSVCYRRLRLRTRVRQGSDSGSAVSGRASTPRCGAGKELSLVILVADRR